MRTELRDKMESNSQFHRSEVIVLLYDLLLQQASVLAFRRQPVLRTPENGYI
jgi:hypothetical protein